VVLDRFCCEISERLPRLRKALHPKREIVAPPVVLDRFLLRL
jgi:hypothetical protein